MWRRTNKHSGGWNDSNYRLQSLTFNPTSLTCTLCFSWFSPSKVIGCCNFFLTWPDLTLLISRFSEVTQRNRPKGEHFFGACVVTHSISFHLFQFVWMSRLNKGVSLICFISFGQWLIWVLFQGFIFWRVRKYQSARKFATSFSTHEVANFLALFCPQGSIETLSTWSTYSQLNLHRFWWCPWSTKKDVCVCMCFPFIVPINCTFFHPFVTSFCQQQLFCVSTETKWFPTKRTLLKHIFQTCFSRFWNVYQYVFSNMFLTYSEYVLMIKRSPGNRGEPPGNTGVRGEPILKPSVLFNNYFCMIKK